MAVRLVSTMVMLLALSAPSVAASSDVCDGSLATLSTDCRGVLDGRAAFCVVYERAPTAQSLCDRHTSSRRIACSAQATCDVVGYAGRVGSSDMELVLDLEESINLPRNATNLEKRLEEHSGTHHQNGIKKIGLLQPNKVYTAVTIAARNEGTRVAMAPPLLSTWRDVASVSLVNLSVDADAGLAPVLPPNLTALRLSGAKLTTVPKDIFALTGLRRLTLDHNSLVSVTGLSSLHIVELNLSANAIELFDVNLPNLEILDLSSNSLSSIPDVVFTMTKLRELHIGDNGIHYLDGLASTQRRFLSHRKLLTEFLSAVTSPPPPVASPTAQPTTTPPRTPSPTFVGPPTTPPSTTPAVTAPLLVNYTTPAPTTATPMPPMSTTVGVPKTTQPPTNTPPPHSDANSAPIPSPTTTPPPNIEPPLTAPPTPSPEPGTSASPTTQPSMSSSDRDASSSSLGNDSQGSSASSPTSASTQTPQPGAVATNESTSDTNHTTLLVTLVVVSVAVVVIAAIGILYARRRRRGNNDQHQHQPPTQSQSQWPMQSPAWGLQKATPVTAFAALTTATTGSSKTTDGHSMGTISEDGDELRQRNTEARNLLLSKRVRVGDVDDVCVVGASSSAVVWLVRYRGSRSLASKRLIQERATPQRLAEFVSETVIAAGLDHPSIVLLAGVAWTNQESDLQALYEYMPNGDLQTLLARTPVSHMPWLPDKLHVAIRIAEALVYTHSFDPPLVHRDVRARNVLLGEEWEAKLSNFGSARPVSEENTMTTTGVGSARWLAPEILSGSTSYGVASDVFAFGVLLSELDTHAEPYSDLDVVDVVGSVAGGGVGVGESALLAKVVSGELRPTVLSSCPREVRSVITECVESDASRRPAMVQVVYSLRLVLKYSERC